MTLVMDGHSFTSANAADYRERKQDEAIRKAGAIRPDTVDIIIDGPSAPTVRATAFVVKTGKPGNNSKVTFRPGDVPDHADVMTSAGFKYSQKGFYWRKNDGTDTVETLIALATDALGGPMPTLPHVETVKAPPAKIEVTLHKCARCGDSIAYDPAIDNKLCASCEDNDKELANPPIKIAGLLPARIGPRKAEIVKQQRANYIEFLLDGLGVTMPTRNGVIVLGDGKAHDTTDELSTIHFDGVLDAAVKVARKQTALPMPAKERPVFGHVAKAAPKMAEPASKLELTLQDGRTEAQIEEARMKAAEAQTIPMFGGVDNGAAKSAPAPAPKSEAYYYVQHCNPMGCGHYEREFETLSEAIAFADNHAQIAADHGDTDFHYIVLYRTPVKTIEKYTVRATDKTPAPKLSSREDNSENSAPQKSGTDAGKPGDAPKPAPVSLDDVFGPRQPRQRKPGKAVKCPQCGQPCDREEVYMRNHLCAHCWQFAGTKLRGWTDRMIRKHEKEQRKIELECDVLGMDGAQPLKAKLTA